MNLSMEWGEEYLELDGSTDVAWRIGRLRHSREKERVCMGGMAAQKRGARYGRARCQPTGKSGVKAGNTTLPARRGFGGGVRGILEGAKAASDLGMILTTSANEPLSGRKRTTLAMTPLNPSTQRNLHLSHDLQKRLGESQNGKRRPVAIAAFDGYLIFQPTSIPAYVCSIRQ